MTWHLFCFSADEMVQMLVSISVFFLLYFSGASQSSLQELIASWWVVEIIIFVKYTCSPSSTFPFSPFPFPNLQCQILNCHVMFVQAPPFWTASKRLKIQPPCSVIFSYWLSDCGDLFSSCSRSKCVKLAAFVVSIFFFNGVFIYASNCCFQMAKKKAQKKKK